MKRAAALLLALGLTALTTREAKAQEETLPGQGSVVFGAERMFGIYSYKGTAERDNAKYTQNGTQFSLLWGANGTSGGVENNFDAMPRIGVDFFVTEGLSLGGSIGYYTSSGEQKLEVPGQPTDSEDLDDLTAVAFAPRVGYLIPLGERAGFWPRGGITYVSFKDEQPDNDKTTITSWQLSAEAMFFLAPVEHFAFVLGPVIDFPIGGTVETENNNVAQPDQDLRWQNLGIAVGLAGYL